MTPTSRAAHEIVLTKDSQLLDGRNRICACYESNKELRFEHTGVDPWQYSYDTNIARRHLWAFAQLVQVIAKKQLKQSTYHFASSHIPDFQRLSYKEVKDRKDEFNQSQKTAKKKEEIAKIEADIEAKGEKVTDAKIAVEFEKNTGERISRRGVNKLRNGTKVPDSGNSVPQTLRQEIDSGVGKDTAWKQRKLQKVRPDLYDSVVAGSKTNLKGIRPIGSGDPQETLAPHTILSCPGNGKIRDWIEAITGDDFDEVLRWLYGNDVETYNKWREIDIIDQTPSRSNEAQAIKNEVKAKIAENPGAPDREIAEAVGISRRRVNEIGGEKCNLPDSPPTIKQQAKIEGWSDYNVKKERKLRRESPQAWQDLQNDPTGIKKGRQ